MSATRLLLRGAVLIVWATHSLAAQAWRTLDVSRPLRDSLPVKAEINYARGILSLAPATTPALYQLTFRYDAAAYQPRVAFDAATRSLTAGSSTVEFRLPDDARHGTHDHPRGALNAALSDQVPLDLTMHVVASRGTLQLGGLRLATLSLQGAATKLAVRFDRPNPLTLRTMTLEFAAGELTLAHAGNAHVEQIVANFIGGALDLDLHGEWTHDIAIAAEVGAGAFVLRVPPDVGVHVAASTTLSGFDQDGFTKRADGWYSENYGRATRHVRVTGRFILSEFTVTRDMP